MDVLSNIYNPRLERQRQENPQTQSLPLNSLRIKYAIVKVTLWTKAWSSYFLAGAGCGYVFQTETLSHQLPLFLLSLKTNNTGLSYFSKLSLFVHKIRTMVAIGQQVKY